MDYRRLALLAVATLLCLSASCSAQEYKQEYKAYKEVPGIKKGSDGLRYIMVGEGEETIKYLVHKDDASKMLYFVNTGTSTSQWHDPRGPAPVTERIIELKAPIQPPRPKSSSTTVAIIAMLPILLFAGGTAGRVAYLQMYYPELLWPTKERKDRRKAAGGKIKTPKARGRMNQDGKGGRSNNV